MKRARQGKGSLVDAKEKPIKEYFSQETRDRYGLHYLGISFVLAWYYCFWFAPDTFTTAAIIDSLVTSSWLSALAVSGVAFLVAPLVLRNVHLYEHPHIMSIVAAVSSVATIAFGMLPIAINNPLIAHSVFPLIFGVCSSLMWVAWGELHARRKSNFALHKFALAFGAVMLPSIIIAMLLPHYVVDVFVGLMPIASAVVYARENKRVADAELPTLLPKATRTKTRTATAVISLAIFMTCVACYFNIAIIPNDNLLPDGYSYTVGIAGSAVVCLLIALAQRISSKEFAAYRILPWLVVTCAIALAIFANNDERFYNLSFVISVALAGTLEVFLIAYFGSLAAKGHLSPVFAFSISSAVVRLGFFVGDVWAIVYERNLSLAEQFTQPTTLLLGCAIVVILVLLMRQEMTILQLTQAPAKTSEIEEVCDAAIEEFSLSKREGEILKLIARGYTIDNVSKKLVISPYTTQTHVRHIYSKMHVRKRSELLDYLNMHREEGI